jgi:hypothetical protein
MFFPWHREFLRQFEQDLRTVSGDSSICLPYWDFGRDQSPADPGWPFFDDLLGGDGAGAGNVVATGPFAQSNGWTLNLGDSPALLRDFGTGATTLPTEASIKAALGELPYDNEPFNVASAAADSFRNRVEGWVGPQAGPNIHNRVHVWVGGSMLPPTSPNDPVFFLNHAKEDQLWAVWMQKHPTEPHYLPNDSYTLPGGHTHLVRLSDHMEALSTYFGADTRDRPIDLLDHKAITWYDTDLPEITLESGPAIAFTNTPAGLTVAKPIRFRVRSGRTVHFTVTGAPTGNFTVVGGPNYPVVPVEANDHEVLDIEVRFVGVGADVQVSAVDIEAHVIDSEGYYAANEGDPFVVGRFHVELVSNQIVTTDSSVVLVLDRSGSMSDTANSGLTKHQLLRRAVGVVHELMKPADQLGISRFDHEADILLPMTPKSAGLGSTLTGSGLDPRGATSIGAGINVGSGLINGPGATHPNKAMIVLSDGNENYPPLISSLPAGTINQTTYAIGFGLPGQVSDPILSQISANSGGYLLVTGNLTDDLERFTLAKSFIQVLKDATRNQTILDPQGHLLWGGPAQEIPFLVGDVDVSLDVVALTPLPMALDFQLVAPGGERIDPSLVGVEPNVEHHLGVEVTYYRLLLPALTGNPAGTHRGTWKALVGLRDPKEVLRIINETEDQESRAELLALFRKHARQPLPYQLGVHTYSNLVLDASLHQDGFAPGDAMSLQARLLEYQQPLAPDATVWAELTEPDGMRRSLPLHRGSAGTYDARVQSSRPGVYRFVVRAEGVTSSNDRFTREKVLTAGVWAGGNRPDDPDPAGDKSCTILKCLLEQLIGSGQVKETAASLGIDLDAVHRCLTDACEPSPAEPTRQPGRGVDWRALLDRPEVRPLLDALLDANLTALEFLQPSATTPVSRRERQEVGEENMFELPEHPEAD